jgi:serine/threonine protein kinase
VSSSRIAVAYTGKTRCKKVDRRTDVWAFGAVVYEMLAGKRAFGGEDVSDTLAAVLRAEAKRWRRCRSCIDCTT